MIIHPTTFVVGAGASVDYGFPLGEQLTKSIGKALTFDGSNHVPTTELMRTAISVVNIRPDLMTTAVSLFSQAPLLKAGLRTASSIDAFLDSRHDSPHFELLGKMAIATCLIAAEHACTSLRVQKPGEMLDLSQSEKTWLARLFKNVLAPGVRKSQLEKIFDNVSFIVFNYDPPCANETCATFPVEISGQQGSHDIRSTAQSHGA